jgi:3-deoxy-manno-octulosonate cytidylyltransferase (CMP-KDO synthetase)
MILKFIGIIPARYASTRFPGKPLADIGGKSMIQRVYEQASKALDTVMVATDDQRIFDAVIAFGGKVVMTSDQHRNGTDRCYEALTKVEDNFDVVINIQGDEPFVHPEQIAELKKCFDDAGTQIATLVKPFSADDDFEALFNANSPKVVFNVSREALYFSRSIIPYYRNAGHAEWLKKQTYYKHIGMYAYRSQVLAEITRLPQSPLELAESLEQLRWLENGYKIKVGITDTETIAIDTPEDLVRANEWFLNRAKNKK